MFFLQGITGPQGDHGSPVSNIKKLNHSFLQLIRFSLFLRGVKHLYHYPPLKSEGF